MDVAAEGFDPSTPRSAKMPPPRTRSAAALSQFLKERLGQPDARFTILVRLTSEEAMESCPVRVCLCASIYDAPGSVIWHSRDTTAEELSVWLSEQCPFNISPRSTLPRKGETGIWKDPQGKLPPEYVSVFRDQTQNAGAPLLIIHENIFSLHLLYNFSDRTQEARRRGSNVVCVLRLSVRDYKQQLDKLTAFAQKSRAVVYNVDQGDVVLTQCSP